MIWTPDVSSYGRRRPKTQESETSPLTTQSSRRCLRDETELLQDPGGRHVAGVGLGPDAVQVQGVERPPQDGVRGLRGVAVAPRGGVEDVTQGRAAEVRGPSGQAAPAEERAVGDAVDGQPRSRAFLLDRPAGRDEALGAGRFGPRRGVPVTQHVGAAVQRVERRRVGVGERPQAQAGGVQVRGWASDMRPWCRVPSPRSGRHRTLGLRERGDHGAAGSREPGAAVLLAASGALMYAASWQRWAGACPWGDVNGARCAPSARTISTTSWRPRPPWEPVGDAAQPAGWSLLVLALAYGLLPWALTGRRPGVVSAAALVGAVLALGAVGVATLRSGLAGSVVLPVRTTWPCTCGSSCPRPC